MSEKDTAERQAQLISALDYLIAADARNSNKHIKVKEWFSGVFHTLGRASRVSETKQAYNRVPEQFKHRDPHVIFVVDDEATGSVIETQVKQKQYTGLDTCLVLMKGPNGYRALVLMMASESPVNIYFKTVYPEVRIELLGVTVGTSQPTWTSGALEGIHEYFCDDSRVNGLHIKLDVGIRFICALLSKRFLILTGLAGSGKTKITHAFAHWITENPRWMDAEDENKGKHPNPYYVLIPVGADWTGNENILGYPDGLQSLNYTSKPALNLILHATEHEGIPHFLILDEMNLSHVERYFADILSLIESNESLELYSGDMEKPETWRQTAAVQSVPPKLHQFPPNLFIIGTVNVDETTYMFSPKVLDRANVIEFRMEAEELERFLTNPTKPDLSKLDGRGSLFGATFVDAAKNQVTVPAEVKAEYDAEMLLFFKTLQGHGAEFGYRTAYETARFIHFYKLLGNHSDGNTTWFPYAFDCVVVQKFLPKLHGSRAKLGPVLKKLWFLCVNNGTSRGEDIFKATEAAARSTDKQAEPSINIPAGAPYPLSAEKIGRMWRLLIENGFASFAEA